MKANLEYIRANIQYIATETNPCFNLLDYNEQQLNLDIVDVKYINKTLTLKIKPFRTKIEPITFIIHQKEDEKSDVSNIVIDCNDTWVQGAECLLTGEIYNIDYDIIQKLDDSIVTQLYISFIHNCRKIVLSVKDNIIKPQELLNALTNPNNQIFEFDYFSIDM